MRDLAEKNNLSVSPVGGKASRVKTLGALLLGAAFALGLGSAPAWSQATTLTVTVTTGPNNSPLQGVTVIAAHFTASGPDGLTLVSTTDVTGTATFNLTGQVGTTYDILAVAQGFTPGIFAQYTNSSHPTVYIDGSDNPQTAAVTSLTPVSSLVAGITGGLVAQATDVNPGDVIVASLRLASNNADAGDGVAVAGATSVNIPIFNVFQANANTYVLNVFDATQNKAVPIGINFAVTPGAPQTVTPAADFSTAFSGSGNTGSSGAGAVAGNLAVSGVVVDTNNFAVAYAPVQLQPTCYWNGSNQVCNNAQNGPGYWTNTDANGRFSFSGISTGPYSIQVNPVCLPNSVGANVCYSLYQTPSNSNYNGSNIAFVYDYSLITTSVTLQQESPGTGILNVVIIDGNGNPLPQSWINLNPDNNTWQGSDGFAGNDPGQNNINVNAPSGAVTITGLYAGNYDLQVNSNFDGSNNISFNFPDGNWSPDSNSLRLTIDPTGGQASGTGTIANDLKIYDDLGNAYTTGNSPHGVQTEAGDLIYVGPSGTSLQTGNTIYVIVPTPALAGANQISGTLTFPGVVNLSSTTITISAQPSCNGGNCTNYGAGYTVIGGNQQFSSTGPTIGYTINVASSQAYNLNFTATYWGWNQSNCNNCDNPDLTVSTYAVVNMQIVPAGRVVGHIYTPNNTLLIADSNNGGGANINLNGNNGGGNWTNANPDGSYVIGGVVPGQYTASVNTNNGGNSNEDYTVPLVPPSVNIVANQDAVLDIHTVNGTILNPVTSTGPAGSNLPVVEYSFCPPGSPDSHSCYADTYIIQPFAQGSQLNTNATLRNLMSLNNGGNQNEFGIQWTTWTFENQSYNGCNNGSQSLLGGTAGWCSTTLPSPGTYDFYLIRQTQFGQGLPVSSNPPRPSFVIMGSTKSFYVDQSLQFGDIPSPNNGQIPAPGYSTNHQCEEPNGPNSYGSPQSCIMENVQNLPIVPVPQSGEVTLQGTVTGTGPGHSPAYWLTQQNFNSFNGNFNNFMSYIPLVTLYDSSGNVKAGGAVLPNPGVLDQNGGNLLQTYVSNEDWPDFNSFITSWETTSGGVGYQIRGLAPNQTYTLVLTSLNYPPVQTTVKTGANGTVTTLNIPLDSTSQNNAGETLVLNVVDSSTSLPISGALVTVNGGAAGQTLTFNTVNTGTATITNLQATAYSITISAPNYSPAALNLALTGTGVSSQTVTLTASNNAAISGTVYEQSPAGTTTASGISVYAYDDTLNVQNAGNPNFILTLYQTLTSTAGTYSFTGLYGGDNFKVYANVPSYYLGYLELETTAYATTNAPDLVLYPEPLNINIFAAPSGDDYSFTLQNPSDFAGSQAYVEWDESPEPFYSTSTTQFQAIFQPIDNGAEQQLNLPLALLTETTGFYNLHVQAESYGGDTLLDDVTFSAASLNSVQNISNALIGSSAGTGTGANSNQVLLDQTGANASALTIEPGALIPVSTGVIPTCAFSDTDPSLSTAAALVGSFPPATTPFVSGVYDITLSSVNYTGSGVSVTLGYAAGTPPDDMDIYTFVPTGSGDGILAAPKAGSPKTASPGGQWRGLHAFYGFPLIVDPLKHTLTVQGIKSLSSVLSIKNHPLAALNDGKSFRPNTSYRALGLRPDDTGSFTVLRPSRLPQVTAPPAKPAAAVNASTIAWNWGPVNGATGYMFYPNSGGSGITVLTTSYFQTGLAPNTAYGARVAAIGASDSALTKLATTYTLADVPVGPFVGSAVFESSMTLTWSPDGNPPGTKYMVSHWAVSGATTTSPDFVLVDTAAPSYKVTGLTANTTYYFQARAVNGAGVVAGTLSDATQTVWTLPTKVTAAPVPVFTPSLTSSENANTLVAGSATWTWAAIPEAQFYNVYEFVDGVLTLEQVLPSSVTSATLIGQSSNTAIGVKVAAGNNYFGLGTLSAAVTGYTLAATPGTLTPTVYVTSMTVEWLSGGNSTSTSYDINYWKTTGATTTVVAESTTTKILTGLTANTSYYFRVRALNKELVPGVPDLTVRALTHNAPGLSGHVAAAAPKWDWAIPTGAPANSTQSSAEQAALFRIAAFPNPLGPGQPGVRFINVPSGASIQIMDPSGNLVRMLAAGSSGFIWNGEDSGGSPAANGVYTAQIADGSATRTMPIVVKR